MSCFCIDLPSDHGSGLLTGLIAVQIHGGGKTEASYKDIVLREF